VADELEHRRRSVRLAPRDGHGQPLDGISSAIVPQKPAWKHAGDLLHIGDVIFLDWDNHPNKWDHVWRVWDGLYVRASEAKDALRALPYDVRYRHVRTPAGLSATIAGQAHARDGTTLNFAVLIGSAGTDTAQLPVVPGAGGESVTGLGNATVITSAPTVSHGRRAQAETDMTLAIENAVFNRESLRPRHG
jgi:hypothetical protein